MNFYRVYHMHDWNVVLVLVTKYILWIKDTLSRMINKVQKTLEKNYSFKIVFVGDRTLSSDEHPDRGSQLQHEEGDRSWNEIRNDSNQERCQLHRSVGKRRCKHGSYFHNPVFNWLTKADSNCRSRETERALPLNEYTSLHKTNFQRKKLMWITSRLPTSSWLDVEIGYVNVANQVEKYYLLGIVDLKFDWQTSEVLASGLLMLARVLLVGSCQPDC